METVIAEDPNLHARHQLLERRGRLETVIADAPDARPLARLLQEVDEALGRIERGLGGYATSARARSRPGASPRTRCSARASAV